MRTRTAASPAATMRGGESSGESPGVSGTSASYWAGSGQAGDEAGRGSTTPALRDGPAIVEEDAGPDRHARLLLGGEEHHGAGHVFRLPQSWNRQPRHLGFDPLRALGIR